MPQKPDPIKHTQKSFIDFCIEYPLVPVIILFTFLLLLDGLVNLIEYMI